MRRAFLAVVLLLVFTGVTAAKTLYVDDDLLECPTADFTRIQDAVNAASSGDEILVYPGVYFEDVVLDKSLTLRGVNHPTVNGEKNGITVRAAGCCIEGFHISLCELAGLLIESNDNVIARNIIEKNRYGVRLQRSSGNFIRENRISDNHYGLYLCEASRNYIYLNDIIDNTDNVYSYRSQNWWHSPGRVLYVYNGKTLENYLANYWSDHQHSDLDGDGICDTIYLIDGEDEDYFPLVMPFENYEILSVPEVVPTPATEESQGGTGAGGGKGGRGGNPVPAPTATPPADGALTILGVVLALLIGRRRSAGGTPRRITQNLSF
ncbi:MAG: right-handed parallel beta-helix repeat-containing protein [Candidatus Alkanophagales archaeon]